MIKAGVGVSGDVRRLRRDYGLQVRALLTVVNLTERYKVRGALELQNLCCALGYAQGGCGLKNMTMGTDSHWFDNVANRM